MVSINNYLGALHELYQCPIINDAGINILHVMGEEDDVPPPLKRVAYRDLEFMIYEGGKIKAYDDLRIRASRGEVHHALQPINPFSKTSQFYIPKNYSTLCLLGKATVTTVTIADVSQPAYLKLECSIPHFPRLISFFCIYPGFGPEYNAYLQDKDINTADDPRQLVPLTELKPGVATITDAKATVHILVLLMGKTFNANNPNQIQGFINNRLKAIQNALGDPEAKFLIETSTVIKMSELWSSLPKLRRMIFNFMYKHRELSEFSTALLLLRAAAMVTINCMFTFLTSRRKCVAHVCDEVLDELQRFKAAIDAMKQRLGTFWEYYRILEPSDSSLAASNFPNLARASVIFVQTFVNTSDTFKQINLPKSTSVSDLDLMAKTELPDIYLDDNAVGYQLRNRDFASELGIKADNIIRPSEIMRRLRQPQAADPNLINQLLAMMAEQRGNQNQ